MNIIPYQHQPNQDLADFQRMKHMVNKANYYMPYVDDGVSKVIHEFGALLVRDDASDIGFFSYKNRTTHYYFGRPAPNHPSPWHHWQGGAIMMLMGMLGSLLSRFGETLLHMSGLVDEMEQELPAYTQNELVEERIDMMLREEGIGNYQDPDPNMIQVDPSTMLKEIPEPESFPKKLSLPQLPI